MGSEAGQPWVARMVFNLGLVGPRLLVLGYSGGHWYPKMRRHEEGGSGSISLAVGLTFMTEAGYGVFLP